MYFTRKAIASVVLASVSGCGGDPISPASPLPQLGASASAVGSVSIFRRNGLLSPQSLPATEPVILVGGMGEYLWVSVTSSTGTVLSGEIVKWSSSNPAVVAVQENGTCAPMAVRGCNHTRMMGISDGTAIITATAGTKSATITVTSLMNPSQTSVVEAVFSVTELVGVGSWHYAPQLRVSATGPKSIDVVAIEFTIPGTLMGPNTPTVSLCGAVRHVAAGQSEEMFREVYGDFELLFNSPTRADPRVASATVFVRLVDGEIRRMTVSGPVVEGTYPSTYTGGTVENPWALFC